MVKKRDFYRQTYRYRISSLASKKSIDAALAKVTVFYDVKTSSEIYFE